MLVIRCKLPRHQSRNTISSLMLYLKRCQISVSAIFGAQVFRFLFLWQRPTMTGYHLKVFLFNLLFICHLQKRFPDGYGHSTLTCFLRKHTIYPTPASIAIGVPCKREHCVVFLLCLLPIEKGSEDCGPQGQEDGQNFCLSSALSMKALLLWPQ